MTTIYNDTLSSQIITSVVRWNSIMMSDLHRSIDSHKNKESITRLTNLLIKKGFLSSVSNPLINSKIITPTEKLLKDLGASSGDSNKSHMVHNAILNNLCLDLFDFENVEEILLEKDINGGERAPGELAPDAEASVYVNGIIEKTAIEFEFTQKSKKRLFDKFLKFSKSDSYKLIIFLFRDERMANMYTNYLIECFNKSPNGQKDFNHTKFVFALRRTTTNSEVFSGTFKVIHPEDTSKLDKYFGKFSSTL